MDEPGCINTFSIAIDPKQSFWRGLRVGLIVIPDGIAALSQLPYNPSIIFKPNFSRGFQMARITYSPEQKAKIIEAAKIARRKGNKGPKMLEAAKQAGYKGGMISLYALLSKKSGKRGRPKGSKNAVKVVAMKAAFNGLQDVEKVIQDEVDRRVLAAIERAVQALKALA